MKLIEGHEGNPVKYINGKTRADSKMHVLGNMPIQQKLSITDTSDKNPDSGGEITNEVLPVTG